MWPTWRGSAVGVYRLWRDSGYAIGALLAGIIADLLSIPWAIGVVSALTFLSGVMVAIVMRETLPGPHRPASALTVTSVSLDARDEERTPHHL